MYNTICQLVLVLISHICFYSTITAAEVSPESTLASLRGQLRETLTALHSIDVSYKLTSTYGGGVRQSDCEWTKEGGRLRLVTQRDGQPNTWFSFNGTHGYSVGWHPERPGFPREINTSKSIPEALLSEYVPAFWLGLRWRGADTDLLTLMDQSQTRVIRSEFHDNHVAHVVDLGVLPNPGSCGWHWTAVLCPTFGGLPVELIGEPEGASAEATRLRNLTGTIRFSATNFKQVTDQTLNQQRWFPRNMILSMKPSRWELSVADVTINGAYAPAFFAPPAPQSGTYLNDDTVPGERRYKIHDAESILLEQGAILREAPQNELASQAINRPAVAMPPDGSRVWLWIRLISAIVLLISAIACWRYASCAD